ncbi:MULTISPECIES: class 1 fructose-bisphosphatase [Salipiger]|jgi:fructose-1,6-bisphosphatase I|uniref:Fructose-1,6-bisphosphatase class 1 n=1 Tax=Salipiger profundus TaxID=1229727 RepID=A0A1U7D4B6_9RHOB|nr:MULTISPECIES: class 1 fructose-bisphosphatase [Salipiger]APX22962.1 fructose-1,6-bisphosphatase I [Salipiger profundus]GGA12320.1 fructose-1,6-bisphosphatase class 1 [Salipiger profundus]SFD22690.1 D-fructose 1,6-bisphosphatase [Salipiger profundus]
MLTLPNDRLSTAAILPACLPEDGVGRIIGALAHALPAIAARLAAGKLPGDPAALVGNNESGDAQKALDVGAHDHILAEMHGCGVRHMLSEEAEAVETIDPNGAWDIAIDPIDGSGSIGIGAPLGMLFVIYPTGPADFARKGSEAVAAGYASFGHSLDFGYTTGEGVQIATFDGQDFRMAARDVTLKPTTSSIAYNASNERHWSPGLQAWARDLRAGKDGPRGRDFNMRWLAAAVGELHRILLKGGAFLYPADRRPGYEGGRLRLAYEAVPIALLIEAAGGRATDGTRRILDLVPATPHENVALVFGATDEVDTIARYIAQET